VPHRLGEVVVLSAAVDAWGHHITRGRAAGIDAVLRQSFADDVAVRHHADQLIILANWNGAERDRSRVGSVAEGEELGSNILQCPAQSSELPRKAADALRAASGEAFSRSKSGK
jgi:hypothetical protein